MPQKDNISIANAPTNSGEIVLYQPDDQLSLEVKLENETVWLTQQQIADLFGCSTDNVGLHLKNIFAEDELDKNATTEVFSVVRLEGARKVRRNVTHYNLDAILSVGYRVSSRNATQFRRWATAVLKDYLIKGYNINQRLIYVEERIDRRLNTIEKELADHREKIDFFVRTNVPPVEQVFFNGQFFEARSLLERMVKTAQKRVVIIDPYVDATTFEILDVRQKGVTADIYSVSEHTTLRNAHNATAGIEPINTHQWTTPSHDRWLIIDDNLFLCGHSFKDMGKKLTAIILMETKPDVVIGAVK
jgi:hypothetical protein